MLQKNIDKEILLIGKKIGMTQVFLKNGNICPITIIKSENCYVSQLKTVDNDGYEAIQIGLESKNKKTQKKPLLGHLKKANITKCIKSFYELKVINSQNWNIGNKISIENLAEGMKVDIIAKTKGKGFQGVVKRWHFKGGPRSHGSMSHRRGGSYGHCQWPGEVQKGKKMPGHTGNVQKTIKNLMIIKTDIKNNLIYLKGSIPGPNGGILKIKKNKLK